MSNYNNSKIYSIRSYQTDEIYIGSTTQALCKRIAKHRIDYKAYLKGAKNYVTSFEILKTGNAYIELIEEFPCDNRCQLHAREGYYIRKVNCVNKYIAGRTSKEYIQDNKEKIKEYQKEYRQDNKESIKQYYQDNRKVFLEKRKQYRQDNKESIKQYYQINKESIKEYQKEWEQYNKEKRKAQKKQYRQDNKEIIKVKKGVKTNCGCGGRYSHSSKTRHFKSKIHQKYLQTNQE